MSTSKAAKKQSAIDLTDNDLDNEIQIMEPPGRSRLSRNTQLFWKLTGEYGEIMQVATEWFKVIMMTEDPFGESGTVKQQAKRALEFALNALEIDNAVPADMLMTVKSNVSTFHWSVWLTIATLSIF